MPERLECEVLQKARYINTLTFTFTWQRDNFRERERDRQETLHEQRAPALFKSAECHITIITV